MSSDESVTKGVESHDRPLAVEAETSPADESVDGADSRGAESQSSLPDGAAASADGEAADGATASSGEPASAGGTSPEAPPKRKLRLNPKMDPSQIRARPTQPVAASTQNGSVVVSQPPEATAPEEKSGAETQQPVFDASGQPEGGTDAQPIEAQPQEPVSPEKQSTKREPIDIPPAVSNLDAEMEAEIEAALASGELAAVPVSVPSEPAEGEGDGATAQTVTEETLEKGTHLTGRIQSFHGDDVFLDLGLRSPGVVPRRQFVSGKQPEAGQLIEVVVDRVDRDDGLILVNLPKGLRKVSSNWESLEVGQIVDCVVTKTNKGGLEVTVSNLRGFLPAGQVDFGFISDLEPFVGQKLRVKVIDVNPKKRNLVVSRRDYLKIERKEAEKTLWGTLQEGQVLSGTVKTLKDYGAFIDLGGVDGFLHIGEMSWTRLKHPSEAVAEGQPVEVQVLHLDREKKKISLGMKQLIQNPWTTAADRYPVGKTVAGTVTRSAEFGAFVELEPGLEGLIHISELDYKHVRRVGDVVKVGQTVDAKVLEVDADRKRVSLSLKALLEKPAEDKPDEEQAPSGGEPYRRKRKTPLKGGTGSSSGGGLFGNPRDFQ